MPVIRFPNFSDRTGDVPRRQVLRAHRQRARRQARSAVRAHRRAQGLRKSFASRCPKSILGSGNLLAPRDTHFLVSAQAVFLPIPKRARRVQPGALQLPVLPRLARGAHHPGHAPGHEHEGDREHGPRTRPRGRRGQELYFNNGRPARGVHGERKSDVEARIASQGGPKTADDRSALAEGRRRAVPHPGAAQAQAPRLLEPGGALPTAPVGPGRARPHEGRGGGRWRARASKSDVEQAVLGHGPNLGPFDEGSGLRSSATPSSPSASRCSSTRRRATASSTRRISTASRSRSAASTSTPISWARWCSPRATPR
jgi:hypothetical protein